MIAFEDRVEIEKELKSSSKCTVLLVRDTVSSERMIYREFSGDGEVYRRLLNIECPWLPRIIAVEEHDGSTAVLEEYIQGDTLAFLLENGSLTEQRAVNIAVQLCQALEMLHSLDIVHRDIKPENVILRGDDVVLIDFDVSRLYKKSTTTDTRVMGTTGYAAPEQYGFSQTDARADIYSMGVLLNEMMTGKHPSTELASGRIGCVVEKCVEVNVDRRYASAAELRTALESDGPEPDRTNKRQKRMWLLASIITVIVLICIIWVFVGSRSENPKRYEQLSVSGMMTDNKAVSRMEFSYDLDGDGEEEPYIFAVVIDLPGRKPGGSDSRMLLANDSESAVTAPGVWRILDDESYEQVFEFASLLQNTHTELYCCERWGNEEPEVWSVEPLDGIWTGAIEVVYTGNTAGVWCYVVTAELDGQLLTASMATSIEKTNTLAVNN